jgi:hypothetical protein
MHCGNAMGKPQPMKYHRYDQMTSNRRNPRYWLERRAHRKTGYPLGTVAFYGPDNTRASKAVIGIILSEQAPEPAMLQKWWSDTTDIRTDPEILQQMLTFLDQQRVQRVVMVDRIIGCPHEEGIDYPEGEDCPQCPYWANRDRWTGEPLAQ